MAFRELIAMKKSLKSPQKGDVFILQPQKMFSILEKLYRQIWKVQILLLRV